MDEGDEVIKLVQRFSGNGLVSLNVSHVENRGWLLIYRPGAVTRAAQPKLPAYQPDPLLGGLLGVVRRQRAGGVHPLR